MTLELINVDPADKSTIYRSFFTACNSLFHVPPLLLRVREKKSNAVVIYMQRSTRITKLSSTIVTAESNYLFSVARAKQESLIFASIVGAARFTRTGVPFFFFLLLTVSYPMYREIREPRELRCPSVRPL